MTAARRIVTRDCRDCGHPVISAYDANGQSHRLEHDTGDRAGLGRWQLKPEAGGVVAVPTYDPANFPTYSFHNCPRRRASP